MASDRTTYRRGVSWLSVLPPGLRWIGLSVGLAISSALPADTLSIRVFLQEAVGTVEVHPAAAQDWRGINARQPNLPLDLGAGVRTRERSRAALRVNVTSYFLRQNSTLRLQPKLNPAGRPVVMLEQGGFFLANRERSGDLEIHTAAVEIRPRGTELEIVVLPDGATIVSVLEGEVDLINEHLPGGRRLKAGEQGLARPGHAPEKSPALVGYADIQWIMHYAAVLDLRELALPEEDAAAAAKSLAGFREGALLDAWTSYPADRAPRSSAEAVYYAALLIAFGETAEASNRLLSVTKNAGAPPVVRRLARAHLQLIASAAQRPWETSETPDTATEWLASSYVHQSKLNLDEALKAARRAVALSPEFGFGHARVAELEFSHGNIPAARAAIDRSLALAPRNAQALAVRGFLLASEKRTESALASFNQALEADPRLGDAWLGRGLCHIRRGRSDEARADFALAAASEPQRALLRSYLGKAFYELGDGSRALKELRLAQEMDRFDPTPWLYGALTLRRDNRINEAIRELERSVALNTNRHVYRSRLLLDGDRAVRGANLAGIYQDAGLVDTSVQEAARAVSAHPANASAHLFLANSYQALRDPRQINLRYETPWLGEFLTANLLAPVGGGPLSQQVSQQEYSRLFERDRLGLSSTIEYLSNGDWTQSAAQFGTFGGTGYALEAFRRTQPGNRPNEDLEQLTVSASLKQQLTLRDSAYFQASVYDARSGDVAQYFDPALAHPQLRVRESQEPILIAGYHREWRPGVHTLLVASRFQDSLRLTDPDHRVLMLGRAAGEIIRIQESELSPNARPPAAPLDYRTELEGYSLEAQQLWQGGGNTLTLGGRFQSGGFNTSSSLGQSTATRLAHASSVSGAAFRSDPVRQNLSSDFERASLYAYDHWQPFEPVVFIAGLSYDTLARPDNFRFAPLASGETRADRVSPKLGTIWTPRAGTSLRAAYSRSLGGVSLDQSFRLEPVQIAGFTHTFRNLAPESAVGAVSGAEFESWGLGWDQKLGARAYLGASFEELWSSAERTLGAFDFGPNQSISSVLQELDYRERSFVAYANHLLGDHVALGARYRVTDSTLTRGLPEVPATVLPDNRRTDAALLHELKLFGIFNHDSGFFAEAAANWRVQENKSAAPGLAGENFWQFDVFTGYRFSRRRAELKLGLLNFTAQDYRLNPLTPHSEFLRDRTLAVSFKLNL